MTMLESFERHVLLLQGELNEASRRGVPMDPERHEAFGKKLGLERDKIGAEIQTLVPPEILILEPKADKKKKTFGPGYTTVPRQIKDHLNENGDPKDGSDSIVLWEEEIEEDDDGNPTGEVIKTPVSYTRREVEVVTKATGLSERIVRWVRLRPFSYNSRDQKIAYILFRRNQGLATRLGKGQSPQEAERLEKYRVPQVRDKATKLMKDNAGAKEIEKLFKATGDPLFKLLVEISKINKIYTTYYKGWRIAPDDAVHTTFGTADTGTGQLSSTNPNVQNAPKHGDLAKEFRFSIAAKPGKILLEFDKKAFHAQTLAYIAKDHAYARLAAMDVHSFMTAHRLKLKEANDLLSWTDKDLNAWFNMMKADEKTLYLQEAVPNFPYGMTFQQVRDYKSKKVILGIGFNQGALSIFEQNPESYKSTKEVQWFLDLFSSLFANVRNFQKVITQLAHKQTYLLTHWGYIRHFHDVFRWDPNKWNEYTGKSGDWAHGDDYEAAVAFLPANLAFGMFKEEMLRMAGYRVSEKDPHFSDYLQTKKIWWHQDMEDLFRLYGFINNIHDAVMFHCDYNLKEKAVEDILGIMREPCITLTDPEMAPNGLFVDAEAMWGPDWAHMEKIKGV